jgi:AraC-like DNA-binding protein
MGMNPSSNTTSTSCPRENVRRDAAMRRLSLTSQSVEAVAAALGYAEPRSFTRAFRRWTGMSPSEFADNKIPRALVIMDTPPLDPNGKILKKNLTAPLTHAAEARRGKS